MPRTFVWLAALVGGIGLLAGTVWAPGLASGQQAPAPAGPNVQPLPILRLGEGVYGIKAPGDGMNTGVVVGDDGVFVFACNPGELEERIAAIRTITDKPIRWAANGHAAFDDSGCNSALKRMGATLFGSEAMREHYLETIPQRLAVELTRPAGQRLGLTLAPPDVTFRDRIELHLGEGRTVHLIYMGQGHTIGDTVAYIPDQRVLFTADLTFVELHPTVREGDSANWQRILANLLTWDVDWMVTGHGDIVQGKTWLQAQSTYFDVMREKVRALMREGKSAPQVLAEIDLGPYTDWGRHETVAETVEKLYRELRQAGE